MNDFLLQNSQFYWLIQLGVLVLIYVLWILLKGWKLEPKYKLVAIAIFFVISLLFRGGKYIYAVSDIIHDCSLWMIPVLLFEMFCLHLGKD